MWERKNLETKSGFSTGSLNVARPGTLLTTHLKRLDCNVEYLSELFSWINSFKMIHQPYLHHYKFTVTNQTKWISERPVFFWLKPAPNLQLIPPHKQHSMLVLLVNNSFFVTWHSYTEHTQTQTQVSRFIKDNQTHFNQCIQYFLPPGATGLLVPCKYPPPIDLQ